MNLILWAIPFFLALIFIEYWVDRRRGSGFFRLNDSISSLNAGILSRVSQIFHRLIPVAIYVSVYEAARWWQVEANFAGWIFAFIVYDFCYYWHHRLGHERNLFWASHVVHHSSEEYNLTTALRQSSGSLLGWVFYLPMALVGIEPLVFVTVAALNLLYQFWVHSRHIGQLGWLESVLITPSNHRVHHAINDCYIDKNYGGVFILWDRLFGTYQPELTEQPCVYGIRKPLNSWNPVWTNLHYYTQLLQDSFYTRRWRDKLWLWLAPTGWRPEDVSVARPLATFSLAAFEKFDIEIEPGIQRYCMAQLAFNIAALVAYMAYAQQLLGWQSLVAGGSIIISTFSVGLLLENRPHGMLFEQFRLALLGILLSVILGTGPWQMLVWGWISISLFFSFVLTGKKTADQPSG